MKIYKIGNDREHLILVSGGIYVENGGYELIAKNGKLYAGVVKESHEATFVMKAPSISKSDIINWDYNAILDKAQNLIDIQEYYDPD